MTEIEKLQHDIKVLEEAMEIANQYMDAMDTTRAINILENLKSRLATLTAPKIRDGVLGRWSFDEYYTIYDAKWHKEHPRYKFHPLTIEELIPTLAQWVPGAVRWEYSGQERISFVDKDGAFIGRIPAPPREDWAEVSGEL